MMHAADSSAEHQAVFGCTAGRPSAAGRLSWRAIAAIATLSALGACAATPPVQPAGAAEGASPGAKPVPFGSHAFAYPASVMFPSIPRDERDKVVTAFYDRWKAKYLTTGCGGIYVHTSGGTGADEALTVSEGHGYGMMVTALMAGHDPAARTTFDEMVRLFLRYPGAINRDLMSWAIGPGCVPTQGVDSATDGDLDIAFAFLLANRQWGSTGAIDYMAVARKTIAAVAASDFNSETALPLLGDWATNATFKHSTRPSDFMIDHVRAFALINNRALFTSSVDRMYDVIARVQGSVGRATGLVPDFLIGTNGDPRPAPPDFRERSTDGDYAYNASRKGTRQAL